MEQAQGPGWSNLGLEAPSTDGGWWMVDGGWWMWDVQTQLTVYLDCTRPRPRAREGATGTARPRPRPKERERVRASERERERESARDRQEREESECVREGGRGLPRKPKQHHSTHLNNIIATIGIQSPLPLSLPLLPMASPGPPLRIRYCWGF
ncbi:hypothetical protein M758_7G173300 [Ceratodon purpureus]|nr:hypothetical protein M758_7G173300 [Ceratodon purpureus]